MRNENLLGMMEHLIESEKEKDSLQIGSAGDRIKIYLNFADPGKAKEKIDQAIGIRAYAKMLNDPETELDESEREKMERFLEKAKMQDDLHFSVYEETPDVNIVDEIPYYQDEGSEESEEEQED